MKIRVETGLLGHEFKVRTWKDIALFQSKLIRIARLEDNDFEI